MYGFLFRPKWLAFHALVIVGVVVMINLGLWQLRRHDERQEFNATVTEQIDRSVEPLTDLADDVDLTTVEWARVTASGTYLTDQILVFNRSQNGQAGDNVLTPLVLDDSGDIVLVNRGFIPLGIETPAPPGGAVQVLGRVRPSQSRRTGGLTDSTAGPITEIRRVEIDRIAPQLPGPVLPIYLDLITSEPEVTTGDPGPIPAPELDSGPHRSYAAQWFIFAAAVAAGWVLAVRKSIRSHQRDAADAEPTSLETTPSPT